MNKLISYTFLGICFLNAIPFYDTRPVEDYDKFSDHYEIQMSKIKRLEPDLVTYYLHNAFFTRWKFRSQKINFMLDSKFNATEVNEILNAMKKIEEVSCIRFKKLNSTQIIDSNYLNFIKGEGYFICYAGDQKLEGEKFITNLHLSDGCVRIGPLLHEIMHGLGFQHTQKRSDRDLYLEIHLENVQEGKEHNFNKLIEYDPSIKYIVPFDYKSIMIYNSTRFSKNGKPIMIPKDKNIKLKHADKKTDLSQSDIRLLNYFYQCNQPHNEDI